MGATGKKTEKGAEELTLGLGKFFDCPKAGKKNNISG